MKRVSAVLLGAVLGLVSFDARAQTAPSPAADTPATPPVAADGSGETQGAGQMRTAILSDEAARSHFRVGQLLYSEGRFGDAAREFEQAYFLSNRSALLYNAFVAYRDANDLEHAILTLEEYLRREPTLDEAPSLRLRLEAMRTTLETQTAAQSDVAAERQRLEEERHRFEQDAAAAHARADAAEREIARQHSPVPWVVGGAGLAVLAGAGVSALIANKNISSAESQCPNHVCPRDGTIDIDAQRASLRRPAITTDVMLGVGGATLVTGIVMLIVSRTGGPEESNAPSAAASCDRYGCTTSLSLRF